MATLYTANETARATNAALVKAHSARRVTAKTVRAWVRDNVDAYDDDGYTAHRYDARLRDRIVRALVARSTGRTGTDGRANAASKGRAGTARKARKAPPVRKMGTGPTPRTRKAAGAVADGEAAS